MYEIFLQPPAEHFIKNLIKEKQKKILDKIEELSENPQKGHELLGRLKGLRSLRIDTYRVIYKIKSAKLIVYVLSVGNRGNVYSKNIQNP
ncbi:plasmid stabilization protein [Candidatus Pacearchaeota archaeon CG10_big_fil_rev_8_21_14_0_10_31_24]|nr:MAG: plasmid stabilization protein [Candidatus Pacearchaeota archaeon CG10_big_fil_rev_8_21_14_0_10_31_24]